MSWCCGLVSRSWSWRRCLEHQLIQFNLLRTFRILLSKWVTCLLVMNNNDEMCYSWYITALICDSVMLTLCLCLGASVSVLVSLLGAGVLLGLVGWCLGLGLKGCCLVNNTAFVYLLKNDNMNNRLITSNSADADTQRFALSITGSDSWVSSNQNIYNGRQKASPVNTDRSVRGHGECLAYRALRQRTRLILHLWEIKYN